MEAMMTYPVRSSGIMHRIRCSEVWGGIRDIDLDINTNGLTVSLYSSACDGGKGGDIYYFSVCGSDMLTRIALADVAGHGEAVSHVSQWIYDALVERMNSLDGNEILHELNHLATRHKLEAMTTAAIIGFYIGDSNLYFSYAGHPPVLVRQRDEKEWRALQLAARTEPANLPLGLMNDVFYDQERLTLYDGDRLLLYTDGVIEVPDASGDLFGSHRLLAALEQAGNGSLTTVKNAVLAAIRQHAGGSAKHDDVTLMLIEVC
jgi:phosphoserine phosphatase RsbU/P